MRRSWRRWLPGPKHGVARGVVVFGRPGSGGPEQLVDLLGRSTRLRQLARSHGVTLADDLDSLAVLDRHLDGWSTGPGNFPFLEHEIGCYLGTVILIHAPGTRWRIWPNGHPVVQLASGADLDVFRRVEHDRNHHRATLTSIYADAIR